MKRDQILALRNTAPMTVQALAALLQPLCDPEHTAKLRACSCSTRPLHDADFRLTEADVGGCEEPQSLDLCAAEAIRYLRTDMAHALHLTRLVAALEPPTAPAAAKEDL